MSAVGGCGARAVGASGGWVADFIKTPAETISTASKAADPRAPSAFAAEVA
ncbi:hypothetical protein ACGFK1_19585 [Mycobacterium sp. NPDC048908]|uniref:hypothetical protein n=1 Tax=Mycobacterium sp. NPDC048908 TaxID=3364292 RepID=UPI0037228EDA